MEEKKGPRFGGSKVSEIANIFQAREPNQKEDIIPFKKLQKVHHTSSEKLDNENTSVTIMRTESHVTRFNNARAMFEKIAEENKKDKVVPLQSTKSASSILDTRSRSSSANSETRDTKSHDGSRSPSPKTRNLDKHDSVPALNYAKKPTNGVNVTSNVSVVKTNGFDSKNDERNKPALMKKPEKPERKFNSKELIERQRNWTAHFSKTRSNRYSSDPNKTETKLGVSISVDSNEPPNERKSTNALATRSASFSTRLKSPPTSPPPPPVRTDASRRPNFTRKERPASVIPTTDIGFHKLDRSPITSPITSIRDSNNANDRLSLNLNLPNNDIKGPVPDVIDVKPKEKPYWHKKDVSRALFKETSPDIDSNVSLISTSHNCINKSPLDDKDASRENLSAASGSLSSLSPPSSPSKMKSEQEKQEQEGNEKSVLGE